jgi:peptidoglycan/LPS O-acetylase OafA/YrhL
MMHFNGFAAPHKAYLAVDFFFILSGFVLSVAYERKATTESYYKTYIADRIARLYPLHLLMLLALVPLNALFFWTSNGQLLENGWSYQDGRTYTFLLNLLMLQNVGLNTAGSWNAPSWSISVEMFVNVFLGLLLVSIARKKTVWPYLLALAVLCYAFIFGQFGSLGVIYERAFGFLNSGLLRGFAGISLGVVSYQLWQWLEIRPASLALARYIAAISAIAFLSIMLVFTDLPNCDFAMIPLMFAFVTSVAVVEKRSPVRNGRLRTLLIELGALSYGVYLLHWLILTFMRYQLVYVWKVPIDFNSPAPLLVFLALVVGIAALVHHKFEIPMKARVKKWFV